MATQLKVTGGSLYIWATSGPILVIRTDQFHAQFSITDSGSFRIPNFLAPGSTYTPQGSLVGDQTLNSGTVDFGGVVQRVWFTGALNWQGSSPFTVPTSTPTKPAARNVDFTFDGNLKGWDQNTNTGPNPQLLFDYDLIGKGKIRTRMTKIISGNPNSSRDVTSYFYNFT